MNTNRQLIEQFLQFINTCDATIGKPIIRGCQGTVPEVNPESWTQLDGSK